MITAQSRLRLSSPELQVMAAAVLKASQKLLRDFSEVEHLQVSKKGPGDFVSAADRRSEKTLREALLKVRPECGFLMEESGILEPSNPRAGRFIIDPLDGTTNFLHGLPHFCLSVAYEKDGEILAGVTYDPVKDEMFYAARGSGAYMNDRRLRVSKRSNLGDMLLGFCQASKVHEMSPGMLEKTKAYFAFSRQVSGLRRMGSACLGLAYVAAGRMDGYFSAALPLWDRAVGGLLIRESGGFYRTYECQEESPHVAGLMAGNMEIQVPLAQTMGQ